MHLQLDNLFWKKFMRKNIEFLDCEGHYTELLKEVTDVKLKKKGAVISLKKFFSEEYLYGDYTKLNETFIRNYDLVVPKYKADIEKVIEEADYEGMKTVLDKLKKFISEKKSVNERTKVIHFEDMNKFLKETAEQFANCYGKKIMYQ